jgi:hypothetical protein
MPRAWRHTRRLKRAKDVEKLVVFKWCDRLGHRIVARLNLVYKLVKQAVHLGHLEQQLAAVTQNTRGRAKRNLEQDRDPDALGKALGHTRAIVAI